MSIKINYYFAFLFFSIVLLNTMSGQKDLLANADSLLNQGNLLEAINKYQLILKQSPNYEPALYGLQTSYLRSGNLIASLNINNIFSSDRLLWGKIRTLFYSNMYDSIPLYIIELIRRFPNSDVVNDALNLAILLSECGNDTLNLNIYSKAQFNLEKQDYLSGINELQQIIAKSGCIVDYSYLLLSRIFIAQKQFNQAIATLNEFSMKYPSSKLIAQARYELGMIYLESIKDTIMAKNIFENLISDYPASPESFFARSQLTILGETKLKEAPK